MATGCDQTSNATERGPSAKGMTRMAPAPFFPTPLETTAMHVGFDFFTIDTKFTTQIWATRASAGSEPAGSVFIAPLHLSDSVTSATIAGQAPTSLAGAGAGAAARRGVGARAALQKRCRRSPRRPRLRGSPRCPRLRGSPRCPRLRRSPRSRPGLRFRRRSRRCQRRPPPHRLFTHARPPSQSMSAFRARAEHGHFAEQPTLLAARRFSTVSRDSSDSAS
jgi:hypothetical protein